MRENCKKRKNKGEMLIITLDIRDSGSWSQFELYHNRKIHNEWVLNSWIL